MRRYIRENAYTPLAKTFSKTHHKHRPHSAGLVLQLNTHNCRYKTLDLSHYNSILPSTDLFLHHSVKKSPLWSKRDLSVLFGRKCSYDASSVSIDTRILSSGAIFFSLSKSEQDGANHVTEAIDKGAEYAIAPSQNSLIQASDRVILVENPEKLFREMAEFARKRFQGIIIGVTGSVGKTSTKDIIYTLLSCFDKTHRSIGNNNNHLGLPLSLCNLPEGCSYGVFELGMTSPGHISFLSNLLRPHYSVITSVEPAHMASFSSLKGIANAKAEILDGMSGGHIVLNYESNYYSLLEDRAKELGVAVFSVGKHKCTNCRLLNIAASNGETICKIEINKSLYEYRMKTFAQHHAYNAMFGLSILHLMSLDIEKGIKALEKHDTTSGRGNIIQLKNDSILIDDSYNSSPTSLKVSILSVPDSYKIKILILGDMLELGKKTIKFHKDILKPVMAKQISKVYTVGEQMKHLHDVLPDDIKGPHSANAQEMISTLEAVNIDKNSALLVKASNTVKLSEVVEYLREKYGKT